jgi:protein phosphatase
MRIEVPANALIVLVGAAASGKSHWAHAYFRPTEVVSSDACRALVSDDEASQGVNREAFAVFYTILRQRLKLGRLSVADSTALDAFARRKLLALGAQYGAPVHSVVFHTPLAVLQEHNRMRERRVPDEVLERHAARLERLVTEQVLEQEGYAAIHHLHPRTMNEV